MSNSKKKGLTRISALFLAVLMIICALPLNIFAETLDDKPTETPKYTIRFDANGGAGEMKDVEVDEGTFVVPKSEFEAPEGKEFRAWSLEKDEYLPGDKVEINKDVVLKAMWEDVKSNDDKKRLTNDIKTDDELDVSDVNVGDAVMAGDNTTEGDPEGTVTSKDGKTRITNFEAHWVGTDEDTVLGTTLDGAYYKNDFWNNERSIFGRAINHNNTKLQVRYVISGERLYKPGMIKIKLPHYSRAEGYPQSYVVASNIPMHKAKIVDGKIDYNADYGKSEYIYYIDGDDIVVTNTRTIPAATSGTFLIDYLFPDVFVEYSKGIIRNNVPDDVRNMPDMYKFEIEPQISIDVDSEETISKDSHKLYHQVNKIISGGVYKYLAYIDTGKNKEESELFIKGYNGYSPSANQLVDWQSEWGDNLKPENHEDYYYMVYTISAVVGSVYSNASLKFEDILGKNQGQEIVGYQFSDEEGYTEEVGTKFLPYSSLKDKDREFEINKLGLFGSFSGGGYSNVKHMHVLVAFKKDILKDQRPHEFTNTGKITIKQLNSDDDPVVKTDESKNYVKYVPLPPKAEFTGPPGNKFNFKKMILIGINKFDYKDEKTVTKPANKKEQVHLYWNISGTVKALAETYDPAFGDKNNLDAYKRKTYTAELVDDYLYTGNDYKRELTSEDYEVNSVDLKIYDWDYRRLSRTNIGYVSGYNKDENNNYIDGIDLYGNNGITYPSKIYGRKESTGEWEEIASFDFVKTNFSSKKILNLTSSFNVSKSWDDSISLPKGFTSIKWVIETSQPKIEMNMQIDATLKPSDYINEMFKQNETSPGNSKLRIRNDGTLKVVNNDGQTIGIPSTTKRDENNARTLDLDLENYDQEMYHDTAYWDITTKTPEEKVFEQKLSKNIHKIREKEIKNDKLQKAFIVPAEIKFTESVKHDNGISLREYDSGTFYDLLPIGVSGIENQKIYSYYAVQDDMKNGQTYFKDKNKNKEDLLKRENFGWRYYFFNLNSNYELIENWQNTGRTLLIARYDNAELVIPDKIKNSDKPYLGSAQSNLYLSYDMIYPWDSYKDYGGNLYNFVAFESGRDSMESGLPDVPNFEEKTKHHKIANKALKDLNKDNDNKNFLYAMDETTVSGNTYANTGLAKQIKDSNDPKYSLSTKTKEGGQYSYRIRMQSLSGTTTSGLIFYDSIENYDPLKTDEDYGVKRWKGTLENIDLSHARMRGADPKVYISTLKGLNMQESKDITDTKIWKPYKEGDDLSKVQAIAVDLRHKPDGSEFKLKEEESVNITLNMRAPWNVKEHNIDPEAKALNEIYANTTITTDLNNQSTNKLINTAYTAIELEPVSTEINLNATKKYLDKEGKDIALKGDDFTFELKDSEGKVLQTKTNDNKGNITFDPIKYNSWDVGEYTYKIVEVKGDSETTAYDSHEEIVKVKIEREGNSNLKATITYDEDGAAFNNHEVDPITTSLEARKVYIGKGGLEEKPKAGAFEFVLKDTEGKEIAKTKNDAEGKVVFEGLEFKPNQIGEHKYTIEEVKGNNPAIEYDNTKKNVTVNVSLTKDFKLKADAVYDKGEIPTFTNTLKSASLQLVKLKEGSKTFTLDEVKDTNGFLTSYKVPDNQKDSVLDGAEYELYKIEADGPETLIDTLITKSGISQVVQDIMPGKYKLKETKAPKGYTLNNKDLIFDITDKDAGTIVAKFATDDGIIDMPSSGGRGTKALKIAGTATLITAVALLVVPVINSKRKKEEK